MNPSWRRSYLRYKSYFLNVAEVYKERADIRVYLEILLSLATISIFSIFALRPTLLTIAGLIKEIDSKQATISSMDAKISDITKAQNLVDHQRNNIKYIYTAVPKSPEPDVLVRQLEGLSTKYQVKIANMSLSKATLLGEENSIEGQTDSKPDLSFSFSINSPVDQYPSLVSFLADLEKLTRPTNINSIIINTSLNEIKEKIISLYLTGTVPYLPDILNKK